MLPSVERIAVSPVFVGRGAEMSELLGAFRRAEAGQPQALLIGGDAGVGKTRLLEEFLCAASGRGAATAVGGCVELGADGLPYAPIAAALRDLNRELGPELEQAVAERGMRLAGLLPELGEALSESHDEYGRARLFENTAALFERLSAGRTIVLALEDLHWSDRSTRELMLYLLRSLRASRLVIVATYRTDDLHRRHPLRPFLAELERLRTVQRLELPRLGRAEVGRQLAGILAAVPDGELVARIHRRSEGIPFFVEELAASHQEGCTSGLTDSLRDLLLVRVEALPEEAQGVLRAIAAGGSAVEYRLLAAVLDHLPEDELIRALRRAVDANILRPTADGDGYRFRHALVREAVADDLLPGESSRINRRYAAALDARPELVPADQRAARLASYWYCSGDAARALPAALDAGRAARLRNAFAEQLRMLDRALELWDRVPEESLAGLRPADYAEAYPSCACDDPGHDHALRYVDVLAEAVVAARHCGERERGYTLVKRALKLVDEQTDPSRAAWFWLQRSRLAATLGRSDGRDELMHARRLVDGGPPTAVQAEVLSRIVACDIDEWLDREEFDLVERAVAIAREVDAEIVELHARASLGWLRTAEGDGEQGPAELHEVLRRALQLREPELTKRVYVSLSDAYEGLGRSAEAVETARAGCERLRSDGISPSAGLLLLGNLIESLITLGRLDEAAGIFPDEAPGTDPARDWAFLYRLRTELDLLRDDLPAAAAHLERSGGLLLPSRVWDAIPYLDLSIRLAARQGRHQEAQAFLSKALDNGFPLGKARYAWPVLCHGVMALADARALGGPEPAAELLTRVRAVAARLSRAWPLAEGWSRLLEAELARAEGRSDAALYGAAVKALETAEPPYPLALALYRLAEAEAVAGCRAEAVGLLRRAEERARERGDVPLLRDIAVLAGRLRPEGRAEDSGLGLTPRERDVLRLLTLGRTNRQIAEELFISPKTASVHVSNILTKFAVASRGEAAAKAHRLRLFDEELFDGERSFNRTA